MTNKDSPLPPTVQQASVANNENASHITVDISELTREAYEVAQDSVLVGDVCAAALINFSLFLFLNRNMDTSVQRTLRVHGNATNYM